MCKLICLAQKRCVRAGKRMESECAEWLLNQFAKYATSRWMVQNGCARCGRGLGSIWPEVDPNQGPLTAGWEQRALGEWSLGRRCYRSRQKGDNGCSDLSLTARGPECPLNTVPVIPEGLA